MLFFHDQDSKCEINADDESAEMPMRPDDDAAGSFVMNGKHRSNMIR